MDDDLEILDLGPVFRAHISRMVCQHFLYAETAKANRKWVVVLAFSGPNGMLPFHSKPMTEAKADALRLEMIEKVSSFAAGTEPPPPQFSRN